MYLESLLSQLLGSKYPDDLAEMQREREREREIEREVRTEKERETERDVWRFLRAIVFPRGGSSSSNNGIAQIYAKALQRNTAATAGRDKFVKSTAAKGARFRPRLALSEAHAPALALQV